jgi:hypothetical protein
MGHVGNLLLCVVDGGDDSGGELLEVVGKLVFLGRSFARLLAALGLRSDAAIGVETAQRAVAVIKDARTFLDERLDVVDKLFFIKLVTRCAVGLLNVLEIC